MEISEFSSLRVDRVPRDWSPVSSIAQLLLPVSYFPFSSTLFPSSPSPASPLILSFLPSSSAFPLFALFLLPPFLHPLALTHPQNHPTLSANYLNRRHPFSSLFLSFFASSPSPSLSYLPLPPSSSSSLTSQLSQWSQWSCFCLPAVPLSIVLAWERPYSSSRSPLSLSW